MISMQLLLYRGESFDANFYYHAGIDIDHSFLLIKSKKKILFVSRLNAAFAKKSFKGDVVVFDNPFAALSKYVVNQPLFVDDKSMNYKLAKNLQKICKLKYYSNELLKQRIVKKTSEVRKIRTAVKHTNNILNSLDFKSPKTELDLKKQILVATAELGLEPAFDPIVSTDKSTSYPHYNAAKKKLGSLVLVDYGVKYDHYCSDLTRCFFLDGDKKKKEQYEKLQDIFHSIIDEFPRFTRGKQVANFANKLIEKNNFPKLVHSIGHGIGLDVHELPNLSLKSNDEIRNSTFAIEPAFYLKNYGLRYEDNIYFDGKKVKIL